MKDASLPVTLIAVGLGWLLWQFRLFPDVDWIISLAFIAAGVAVLVIDGFNKNSVVVGPFLIAIGIAWLLHDRYDAQWRFIVPRDARAAWRTDARRTEPQGAGAQGRRRALTRPLHAPAAHWRKLRSTLGVLPAAQVGERTPLEPVRIMPAQGSVGRPPLP